MAYLGNTPARSFISFEKQVFTIVNSQTAYTLSHSVNNENDIRLVINNIVQEPGSGKAYTASGTTLTLSAALTNGTDEMYCVFLGRAVGTVNAPAGSVAASQLAADSVTAAKLNDDIISGQTELATAPADTDEFLVSDAGALKRIDYSLIKGGIEMADQWRLTAQRNVTTSASVLTGWERPDDTESGLSTYGRIGTGMSESSGTFTFPSTGIYLVRIVARSSTASQSAVYVQIQMSKDGSNYDVIGDATHYIENGFTGYTLSEYLADVTDTSNDLIQFTGRSSSGTNTVEGNTDNNMTSVTFIRLGAT